MKIETCVKLSALFFGYLLLFSGCASENDTVADAEKERLRLAIDFAFEPLYVFPVPGGAGSGLTMGH